MTGRLATRRLHTLAQNPLAVLCGPDRSNCDHDTSDRSVLISLGRNASCGSEEVCDKNAAEDRRDGVGIKWHIAHGQHCRVLCIPYFTATAFTHLPDVSPAGIRRPSSTRGGAARREPRGVVSPRSNATLIHATTLARSFRPRHRRGVSRVDRAARPSTAPRRAWRRAAIRGWLRSEPVDCAACPLLQRGTAPTAVIDASDVTPWTHHPRRSRLREIACPSSFEEGRRAHAIISRGR